MDTEKQRQHRHNDARLTESRNARSKQLLMMPTESLNIRLVAGVSALCPQSSFLPKQAIITHLDS